MTSAVESMSSCSQKRRITRPMASRWASVPRHVLLGLDDPPVTVGPWKFSVEREGTRETAVDEHRDVSPPEEDVRTTVGHFGSGYRLDSHYRANNDFLNRNSGAESLRRNFDI